MITTVTVLNKYRHFYFHAKKWYTRTDPLQDLFKVHASYCGIEPKDCELRYTASILLDIVTEYMTYNDFDTKTACNIFQKIISDAHPGVCWKVGYIYLEPGKPGSVMDQHKTSPEKYDYWLAVCMSCLSYIRFRPGNKIPGDLGEPDPKVLPITDEKLKQYKRLHDLDNNLDTLSR